jgi:hypothetical protein
MSDRTAGEREDFAFEKFELFSRPFEKHLEIG